MSLKTINHILKHVAEGRELKDLHPLNSEELELVNALREAFMNNIQAVSDPVKISKEEFFLDVPATIEDLKALDLKIRLKLAYSLLSPEMTRIDKEMFKLIEAHMIIKSEMERVTK